jgi:hypothetical protein
VSDSIVVNLRGGIWAEGSYPTGTTIKVFFPYILFLKGGFYIFSSTFFDFQIYLFREETAYKSTKNPSWKSIVAI